MFWDESQFSLAVFILKGVKCLCAFHQVPCWCFSSSRCLSWTEACFPAGGHNLRLPSALAGSSGSGWRYQLRRRLMETVLHHWLPACPLHTHLALHIDFLLCFQRCPWYQSPSSFSSLFPCLYHWVQLGAKGQHKIRGAWPAPGLLWLLVSGGGRVGWETVSYLEFPVWVLGKLLGIPILITNFQFQLRSLPDKLEPNTRCVTNYCLPFCSFEAPCNKRLWTWNAVQKLHLDFLVRKPVCPRLFVVAVVTLSNVCVH